MIARIVMAAWFGCACGSTTSTSPIAPAAEHDVSGQWDASPCTASGEVTTIVGELVVAPFGKGTDGARIVPDDGDAWILTYRATSAMRELDHKRVAARGRPCRMEGQAIVGRHFDAQTLTASR